ncbi:MAG: HAMP domain-containing histidine kinase, partial [Butyrivibrio sp.]|nr:HAMP domain-containing histidine kinase [Butyrivibrio sp.]
NMSKTDKEAARTDGEAPKMNVEASKTDSKIKKPVGIRFGWIVTGLLVSLTAAVLYVVGYGSFAKRAVAEGTIDNPLETQVTTDWLMGQTYVLYHDLMQSQSPEELSYTEIYVKPKEGCEWVLDEQSYSQFIRDGGTTLQSPNYEVVDSVYSYLQYLREEYFATLEEQFTQINNTFDYICEDLNTGATVSNLPAGSNIVSWEQYFYLSLLFDSNGNCRVEDVVCGTDANQMRKLVNESTRGFHANFEIMTDNEGRFGTEPNVYFTIGGPADCRVVYSISEENWTKYRSGEYPLMLHGYQVNLRDMNFVGYMRDGIVNLMLVLCGIVALLAFFMPVSAGRDKTGRPESRWLRLPVELMYILFVTVFSLGLSLCFHLAIATMNGEADRVMERLTMRIGLVNELLVYAANLLLLTATFFMVWYFGMNLRDIRRLGIWGYIKARSLIYRFFPFIKSKAVGLYEMVVHFDVTKNANKLIIRLVLINGIILFFISSLWFGGFGIAVVYSALLYIVLRKYISDLQKKYNLLLGATNEIAEGNLNVQIKEDLGVFEPFKPQVYRIQNGFKKAVEEEVKSQRMKAELITNVSHDLKTPLTAIITYINLLKEENLTEEQQREYLDTLERKSLRLKALIEDLFEVSKANSQSMALNIMDVDVMNLVRQAAFEMEDKLKERNLELRFVLPEGKAVLPLDSQRTYRIYENLFSNISKYALSGTRVYVNGFFVEDKVIITLKNITAEEISVDPEELTDRFVRGDASRNTEGSGLGLAIAKSFTQLQGGELTIEVDGDLFKVTTVWHIKR